MNSHTKPTQGSRSLIGLLIAQFFGAFNDNAWKLMVFTIATRPLLLGDRALSDVEFERSSQYIATLSLLSFLLPMMAFSLPAGSIADSFSKQKVIVWAKGIELFILACCALVLFIAPTSFLLPLFLLSLLGAQSALLGPAKYGIMPEILPFEKLSHGNGLLEMWTMIAIIAGTGLGPALLAADGGGAYPERTWLGALWLFLLSVLGFLSALFIAKLPAVKATRQTITTTAIGAWRAIKSDNALWIAIIGSLCYWTVISLLGQNVLVYAKALVKELESGELYQGIPPAAYGMGIALGALLAGRWSGNSIEYGFIPLGAIGFAISALLLGALQPAMAGTVVILLFMGIASGLLIVPLHAIVQWRAPADKRGAIIAFGNVLDVGGMTVGSLIAASAALIGFNLRMTLIASALLVVAATLLAIKVFPKALIRLSFILLTHTFYRLNLRGVENIPKEGPLLLAANHLSLIDALFIMAALDRQVHIAINEADWRRWWLRPVAQLLEAFPLTNQGSKYALEYLSKGEVVVIFPEGEVSLTGMMLPFQEKILSLAEQAQCPLIPVHLDDIWGSIFSYQSRKFFNKWPKRIPYPVGITFGPPLPGNSSGWQLRQAIKELESDAAIARQEDLEPMHRQFIRNARREPWRLALASYRGEKLSNLRLLAEAIILARKLNTFGVQQKVIGIALPTSIPSVILNIAATLCGFTIVNLNYTADNKSMESTISQAMIEMVISSRTFLYRTGLNLAINSPLLFYEEIYKPLTLLDRLYSYALALFAPILWLERLCGYRQQGNYSDLLTIAFTSGSSGKPKGVLLSHGNLAANSAAVAQVIPPLNGSRSIIATLPLFHSFGYFVLWLGLSHQLTLLVHRDPKDSKAIAGLATKYNAGLLLTTPTYLAKYLNEIPPGAFGSLKCLLTGGEKLPLRLAERCETHFGIGPIEGYGATECSPVICTNTLDVRIKGSYQKGHRRNSVGLPLPGVAVKIIDISTGKPSPPGELGVLMVKGPNIMKGYLGDEKPNDELNATGWYNTGDIASSDESGFISITDRIDRVSKVAGEIISHTYLEELLNNAAETRERVFSVTTLPDDERGEQLVIIHTLDKELVDSILNKVEYSPKTLTAATFLKIKSFPQLPSGKIDLLELKKFALASLHEK